MNRVAASLLLAGAIVACKKHEEASVRPETTTSAQPATVDSSAGASPAPSETATVAASSSAAVHAQAAGILGLLNQADPNAPTAPWGRENSLGNDPMATGGNMWGDAFGDGGLGLRGSGSSGHGEGIGLGNIGTIGHGAGTGTSQGFGGHSAHTPKIRQGQMTVTGRLPPEVIRRIVRQNFGRFRLCYEQGLLKDPKLAGTVATKFVIDTQGAITSSARDASTTMTDATVVSCINGAFSNLSFPQPEGGIVVVVYPVILEPGDP